MQYDERNYNQIVVKLSGQLRKRLHFYCVNYGDTREKVLIQAIIAYLNEELGDERINESRRNSY